MPNTAQYRHLQQANLAGNNNYPGSGSPQKAYSKLLPAALKQSMEAICGLSLNHVKVHYNSPLPEQVNALAFAQGDNIYLGPNSEHHLPHELGHIVQQALGMVKPTSMVNGVAINDDPRLEQQATDLGKQALNLYQHKIASARPEIG